VFLIFNESKSDAYRACISDGGELYIHSPGAADWLLDKVKY